MKRCCVERVLNAGGEFPDNDTDDHADQYGGRKEAVKQAELRQQG